MRYFFHIRDGRNDIDHEGTELPDNGAARREAIAMGAAMLNDNANSWDGREWRLTVVDEKGTTIFILRYSADDLSNSHS